MNQGFVSVRGNIDLGGAYRYICDIQHGAYGVLAALYACRNAYHDDRYYFFALKIRAARRNLVDWTATTECRLPAQLLTACSRLVLSDGSGKRVLDAGDLPSSFICLDFYLPSL
jgi:hypothetical protein